MVTLIYIKDWECVMSIPLKSVDWGKGVDAGASNHSEHPLLISSEDLLL